MSKLFSLLLFSLCILVSGPSLISAQNVAIAGVKNAVTVRRDGRDIPYIEAKNDSDLYFMQGYQTARDRLWQLDLMRRLARGETAEIFGNSALEQDKRWRRFGFATIANESLASLSPELRAALNDYARGVNAYISSLNDKQLPVEFQILQYKPRPWEPTDTLVVGKILADALSTTWGNDLLRASLMKALPKEKFVDATNEVTHEDVVLYGNDTASANPPFAGSYPDVSPGLLAVAQKDAELRKQGLSMVGLYAEDLAASNNFVVSGKRTVDGKPILENDPHLQPTAPGIWYLVHLSTPTMRVAGVTFPGVPGVVLGHNDSIAWGATNVGPDVQDLYIESLNDKGEVKTSTGLVTAKIRREVIKVRTNPLQPATTDVSVDYTETPHGPIITEEEGKKYALKWTALDPKNQEFEAFFKFNRAKNWSDFRNALKTYGGATQNFVYADVKGNIGWYAAGRIPIRRTGDGRLPYDGSTTDGDWVGYIPFAELPHLYNPPGGIIVTANQRIVGTDYKFTSIGRDVAPPFRARMIYDDLTKKPKITMDDARDAEYETYSIPLANLAKAIVAANAASPDTLEILKSWDGRMTADSRGAAMANEIRSCMQERISNDNKPLPQFIVRDRILNRAISTNDLKWLPAVTATWADLMRSCNEVSHASLAKRLGSDPAGWVWGKIFQSRFPHPLAAAPLIGLQFTTPIVPIDGSGQTPNVGSNVSMRFITSPGNWDSTRHVIPLGESGDPKSPHFKDQFDAWRTGNLLIFPFSEQAVQKAEVSSTVYAPK